MSRTRPAPSVLSPNAAPSSKRSVLTAPAACARALRRVAHANASSLNGSVTFSPRPPSSRNRSTLPLKPSSGASNRPYSMS